MHAGDQDVHIRVIAIPMRDDDRRSGQSRDLRTRRVIGAARVDRPDDNPYASIIRSVNDAGDGAQGGLMPDPERPNQRQRRTRSSEPPRPAPRHLDPSRAARGSPRRAPGAGRHA